MSAEGRFTGKVAIVTGAASGIGRAVAERLAREGARVLIADRDADNGPDVAAGIHAAGGEAAYLPADVTRYDDCRRMVDETASRWGGLDLLVNNAGVGGGAPVAALEEEAWDHILDVNLKGVYLCSRAGLPALAARGGGAILNVASIAGLIAAPAMGAYAASKAGVMQLTKVLALEGARQNIRANALCPIWVDTPMVRRYVGRAPDPEQTFQGLKARIPLGRIGTVDDVAAAALFLLSDEASFITGVALPLDGGALCGSA